MATFYMTVGIPASGKSTYIKNLKCAVFSSDTLRKELWGSEDTQGDNTVIFNELQRRIRECLNNGLDCVLDATNINSKKRKAFLSQLPKGTTNKAIVFATTLEQCIEANSKRERKVPVDVIERMYKGFNFPLYSEGFGSIEIVYPFLFTIDHIYAKIQKIWGFDQHNSHHKLTLGQHCWQTGASFFDKTGNLAGYAHDFGKEFTQTFVKANGTIDTEAHYYGHENISAYLAMFHLVQSDNIIEECQLIQMHMMPYLMSDEKVRQRAGRLYDKLMILHECDKLAH